MIEQQWKLAFLSGFRNLVKTKSKIRHKESENEMKLPLTHRHCFKYINRTQLYSQLFMLIGGWDNLNKAKLTTNTRHATREHIHIGKRQQPLDSLENSTNSKRKMGTELNCPHTASHISVGEQCIGK